MVFFCKLVHTDQLNYVMKQNQALSKKSRNKMRNLFVSKWKQLHCELKCTTEMFPEAYTCITAIWIKVSVGVFVQRLSAVCDGVCVETKDAGVREIVTDGRLAEGGRSERWDRTWADKERRDFTSSDFSMRRWPDSGCWGREHIIVLITTLRAVSQ